MVGSAWQLLPDILKANGHLNIFRPFHEKKKKREIILLGKLYPWSSLSPVIYLHVGNDRVWQADSKTVPGISAIWCSCPLSASLSECGLDLVTHF